MSVFPPPTTIRCSLSRPISTARPGRSGRSSKAVLGEELRACCAAASGRSTRTGRCIDAVTAERFARAGRALYGGAHAATERVPSRQSRLDARPDPRRTRICSWPRARNSPCSRSPGGEDSYRSITPAEIHARCAPRCCRNFRWLDEPAPTRITRSEKLARYRHGRSPSRSRRSLRCRCPGLLLALVPWRTDVT